MIKLHRIRSLIRSAPQFSIQRLAFFTSNSAANPRTPYLSSDEDEVEEAAGATSVYQYALRHQRPSTIKWQLQLKNSVSLIGSVMEPLRHYNTRCHRFGGYTYMKVINSGDPDRTFRIRLEMWDDIGKLAAQQIKTNDLIYVSGHLLSYPAGDDLSNYKIKVNELTYAAQPAKLPYTVKHEESLSKPSNKTEELQSEARKKSEEGENLNEIGMEMSSGHLSSWQLFFCKPYEWWDKREYKHNSSEPDFKHKYNGECLWLRPNDPPWIHKQLQMLDLEKTKQRQANKVAEAGTDVYKNHNHLWHVFFSDPHEWWDNRKNKKHPRSPDFKHKDTGEALWIDSNDPPWVKSQLQLLDSRMEEQWPGKDVGSCSRVSQWLPDD